MNPFLPPADLRAVHRRLGQLLPGSVHTLLRAADPVEDPEPKPVKVAKPRKVRPDPNAKHTTHRAQLLLALTDSPQDYRDLARETGLMPHTVKLCMSNLVYKGLARNVGKLGQRGLYVLPAVKVREARGPFDV